MKKVTLIILGIAIALMGVLALIPAIPLGTEPLWHSIAKIIVGIIAVIIGFAKD